MKNAEVFPACVPLPASPLRIAWNSCPTMCSSLSKQNHRYPNHTQSFRLRDFYVSSYQPSNMHKKAKIPTTVSSLTQGWPREAPFGLASFVGGKNGIGSLANLSPCTAVIGLIVDLSFIFGILFLLHIFLVQHSTLHLVRDPVILARAQKLLEQ